MKCLLSLAVLLFGFAGNADLVSDGKQYFTESTCNACHSLTSKKEASQTGPALYGVTKRPGRSNAWLVSWISDPESMLKTDKLAQQLLKENGNVPMTGMLKLLNKNDMTVVKKKAEAIVAFLADNDSKPDGATAAKPKKKN
jgi:cytochrome c2